MNKYGSYIQFPSCHPERTPIGVCFYGGLPSYDPSYEAHFEAHKTTIRRIIEEAVALLKNDWRLEPGEFRIAVGGSSADLPVQITIEL